jgi:hypothetical protein
MQLRACVGRNLHSQGGQLAAFFALACDQVKIIRGAMRGYTFSYTHSGAVCALANSEIPSITHTPETKKPASAGFFPLQPDGHATPVVRVSCCWQYCAIVIVNQGNSAIAA